MDINKLMGMVCLCVAMTLCSCSSNEKNTSASVSREVYDELQKKYDMLKESVEGTLSANEEAQLELNRIMVELNTITGRTISLQKNVESGVGEDNKTTAERISESIAEIKQRLNSVAASNTNANKQTLALVENLRQTIALNEQEIDRLNTVIQDKDQQITNLDNQLSSTSAQLDQTLLEMQQNEKASWLQMGDELLSTADLLPNVKGHGNMKPIKQAKLTIIKRAKAAYQQAYSLGAAEAITKMKEADRKYNEAYNR
ncbi:MAG: hypothetical protein J6I52_01340 [Prevotella sp.]|nr:hypothetical protein [Prevotella sp.]